MRTRTFKGRAHDSCVDVLFVNPPSPDGFIYIRDINRHGRSSWERMIWPQTSLAYLAAIAEQEGYSVDIVDCIAEEIDWQGYRMILSRLKPAFCVGNIISVTFSNDVATLQVAKEQFGTITIGMGPHLTNDPARTLREARGLDFIIRNEAEATLAELLRLYRNRKSITIDSLRGVKGISFLPGRIDPDNMEDVVNTPQRPFIEDLDSLPRPRHDLLALDRYWAPFLGNYTFVEASRGCAYRCIFCRQAVMWQWKIRSRKGACLAEEALYVHSLGVNHIMFHADTFTLDMQMVVDLCNALKAQGSPFRWSCNTHVKPLLKNSQLLPLMKKAGCWMIAVGIESADDQVLKNIKKQITADEARTLVEMIDQAGIEAWGYFVLGLPGDTRQTMRRTMDFALRIPLKMAKFDTGAPYPGTEFHDYCVEHGYLRVERFEEFDQNASAVVEYPHLSRKEIRRAVWLANLKFIMRPHILKRILREIRDVHYVESLMHIAVDQARMLSGVSSSKLVGRIWNRMKRNR